jgi:hypothetical protein
MLTAGHTAKGTEKMLLALAAFDYLTAAQVTRLCYAKGSLTYVKAGLKTLVESGFAVAVGGRGTHYPRVYTPTGTGYAFVSAAQGIPQGRRVRPREEEKKAANQYFLQHTIAVNDVLIATRRLTKNNPAIVLNRLYLERELKRKIYVAVASPLSTRTTHQHNSLATRQMCLEPDAAVDFSLQGKWREFFHLEVYRTHLREYRFKYKIQAYVSYAASSMQQKLFQTTSLNIAVLCSSSHLAETLQRWTEEVLGAVRQPELGERFFFTSVDPASASPEELFLTPVWEQPFSDTKTPLLMLE